MDTKVWICSSCFKSACSGERVLLLGNRSGLVETDIKSLHKLSEELHQYKPGTSVHSFWHSSVFLTFIGPIIIICLFFLLAPCFLCFFQDFWGLQVVVKQNALSPIPPAEHEPIDSQLCVSPTVPMPAGSSQIWTSTHIPKMIRMFSWNLQLVPAWSRKAHYCLSLSKPCPHREFLNQRKAPKIQFHILGNYCSFFLWSCRPPNYPLKDLVFDHTWAQTHLVVDISYHFTYNL